MNMVLECTNRCALELKPKLRELKASERGQTFALLVKDPCENDVEVRFSLNAPPRKLDPGLTDAESAWEINFHTSLNDSDKVRYGQFIMHFVHERGRLMCLRPPDIFFKRI